VVQVQARATALQQPKPMPPAAGTKKAKT